MGEPDCKIAHIIQLINYWWSDCEYVLLYKSFLGSSVVLQNILLTLKLKKMKWKNLAPELIRQRCIIELNTDYVIGEEEIKEYLQKLSGVVDMTVLQEPFSYPAVVEETLVGYGGWIHWATSGAHAYSYIPQWTKTGKPLLTIDAYTCKCFSLEKAAQFTKEYFNVTEIVWKEVDI